MTCRAVVRRTVDAPPRPSGAIVEILPSESPGDVVARLRAAGVVGVTVARWGRRSFLVPAGSSSEGAATVSVCQPVVIEADTQPPSRAALPRPWWRRALFLLTTPPEEF